MAAGRDRRTIAVAEVAVGSGASPGRWLSALLDVILVAVMAWQGWLMAPVPAVLITAALSLAVFLVEADLRKIGLMRPGTDAAAVGVGGVT